MYALGFWLLGCSVFVLFGTIAWNARQAVRFWNISQQIQVSNIKKYNHAVAKMWFVFALLLAVTGMPLLTGQNSAWIVVTILGTMFLAIALMVVYIKIEKKYRVYS